MSLDATIQALRAKLAVQPENLSLRLQLASFLKTHGYLHEAQAEYQTAHTQAKAAITQHPADPQRHEQLADILSALGDEIGALTQLGIATALRGTPEPAPQAATETAPSDTADDEPEPIDFSAVAGMEEIKERIRKASSQPRLAGGLLLYGPPSCGKSFLARAAAGELGAKFLHIGINEMLDMGHGQSERMLQAVFKQARRLRPCLLFVEGVDAIDGNRLDVRQQFQRTLIKRFLTELDGASHDNQGLLVIGATNVPWQLDADLRQAGGLAYTIFVSPPDQTARHAILRQHLHQKPLAVEIDIAALAQETEGWSGADLRSLVDSATEDALQQALRSGRITPLSNSQIQRAARVRRPSTSEWLNTAKNHAIYGNEDGFYDEIAAYLRKRKLMS